MAVHHTVHLVIIYQLNFEFCLHYIRTYPSNIHFIAYKGVMYRSGLYEEENVLTFIHCTVQYIYSHYSRSLCTVRTSRRIRLT